jgi:hypothetical protein
MKPFRRFAKLPARGADIAPAAAAGDSLQATAVVALVGLALVAFISGDVRLWALVAGSSGLLVGPTLLNGTNRSSNRLVSSIDTVTISLPRVAAGFTERGFELHGRGPVIVDVHRNGALARREVLDHVMTIRLPESRCDVEMFEFLTRPDCELDVTLLAAPRRRARLDSLRDLLTTHAYDVRSVRLGSTAMAGSLFLP